MKLLRSRPSHRELAEEIDERQAYRSCKRKKKFKSGEANKIASRFNQRKYQCPICGHWHLTKQKG